MDKVVDALSEQEVLDQMEQNRQEILRLQLKNQVLSIHLRLYQNKQHREQETIYNEKGQPTAIGQAQI
jgi:hypothetical protein